MKKVIPVALTLFLVMVLSSVLGVVMLYSGYEEPETKTKNIDIKRSFQNSYDTLVVDMGYDSVNIIPSNNTDIVLHYYGNVRSTKDEFNAELIIHENNNLEVDKRSLAKNNKPVLFNVDSFYRDELQLDIYLPKGLNLEVEAGEINARAQTLGNLYFKTFSGDIELVNLTGNITSIETSSGNVNIHGMDAVDFYLKSFSGDTIITGLKAEMFNADLNSGDMQVDFTDSLTKKVVIEGFSSDVKINNLNTNDASFDLNSGDIEVRESKFNKVNADTFSGDIKLASDFADARLNSNSGNIVLNASMPGKLFAKTHSGVVTLDFSKHSNFKLDFETLSGKFENEFPILIETLEKRKVSGVVGNTSIAKEVMVKTTSGNLKII